MAEEVEQWLVHRMALVELIRDFARTGDAPEKFERQFLDLRSRMISEEPDENWARDDVEDRLIEEVLWAVDDFVPSSLGVDRDDDQTDEAEFVARVRAEWERYQAQQPA